MCNRSTRSRPGAVVLHGICKSQLDIDFDKRYFGSATQKIANPGLRTCNSDNPSDFNASLPLKNSPVGLRPREGPLRAKSAPNNRSGGLRSRNLSFWDQRRRFPLPQRGKKTLQNLLSGGFGKIMFLTPDPTLTTGGRKYDFSKISREKVS